MRKQFAYTISDLCFKKPINVDITECKTVQDLQHLISSFINQAEDQFIIYNASLEQLLSAFENNYEFNIIFYKSNFNINIEFPNENVFSIYNCYDMTFDDIFKYLQEDKSLYYSNMCINNIDLIIWGIPLPREGKHLTNIPNDVNIRVQNNTNTITLAYDQKAFIFSEYEPYEDAKAFIEKILGTNVEITIRCISDNNLLQNDDVLVADKRYEINAICNFSFVLANKRFDHKMDYFSTVLSAKQFIAMQYVNNNQLDTENDIICSAESGQIADDNVRLSVLNKIGPIFFSIKTDRDAPLLINFIFDDGNEDKYNNFCNVFEKDFSICAISYAISDRFSINDKIVLMYQGPFSKIDIDGSATLEDICHLISQIDSDGNMNNILYVKIIKENIELMPQQNDIIVSSDNNNNNNNDENIIENEDAVKIIETEVKVTEININDEQNNEPQQINQQTQDSESKVENLLDSDSNSSINTLDTNLIVLIQPQLKNKRIMGKGATSTVYKVNHINDNYDFDKDETEKVYSLKVFNKDLFIKTNISQTSIDNDDDFDDDDDDESNENDIDIEKVKSFLKEYELLARINHQNIIKSHGIYFGDAQNAPCILFEYAPTSLDKCIPSTRESPIKLDSIDLIVIIYEICQAMDYIHKMNIIHRDLKPSNILISKDKHAKLCDFGIAKFVSSDLTSYTHEVGTLKFMAPEIFDQETYYDEKVDVYSFGVNLHFILSNGKLPIIRYQRSVTLSPTINNVSKQLIMQCLSFNPSERPSFEQIIEFIVENQFMLFDGIENELASVYERLDIKK